MSEQARTGKASRQKRSHFNPTIVGCIEGLRLAAWTIEKTPGMAELYRERNGVKPAEPDPSKDGALKITDPRDPISGYVCARLIMRSLGIELALKQIALLSRGDGSGALNTHDLLKLWEDLPEETRDLLEKRFRSEVKVVYRVPRDNQRAFETKEPPTIKEVCEKNRHGFIDARYISEARPRPLTTSDEDLKGVLMFLTAWILGKMGYAPASMPADDATLQARYEPNPVPRDIEGEDERGRGLNR